VRGLWSNCRAG